MIYIKADRQVYPIALADPLEETRILPVDSPNIVGCVTEEEIKKMRRNVIRLFKWGIINQQTLETINQFAKDGIEK